MSDRTFATHQIRRAVPVPTLWDFAALDTTAPVPARLPVPSAWELVPALHNYRGRAHYTTRIRCGGNIRMSFGGVSFRARVLLDGNEIARHYGAFTAFETVVRRLPEGEHTLTVEVDNRFGEDSALHVPNDYYSYGGITRPVVIEQLPDVFVERVGITTKRAELRAHMEESRLQYEELLKNQPGEIAKNQTTTTQKVTVPVQTTVKTPVAVAKPKATRKTKSS